MYKQKKRRAFISRWWESLAKQWTTGLLFTIIGLMCIPLQSFADDAQFNVLQTSGNWVKTELYLGETSGSWSGWLDDVEITMDVNGKSYSICHLSDLGFPYMAQGSGSTSGACNDHSMEDVWQPGLESARKSDGIYKTYNWQLNGSNRRQYSCNLGTIYAYDPYRTNNATEYWTNLWFCFDTQYEGKTVTIHLSGNWRNNGNYNNTNTKTARELKFTFTPGTCGWTQFGTLKRSGDRKLNYTGDIKANGTTWYMQLYNNSSRTGSPTYTWQSTSTSDTKLSGDKAIDNYQAYVFYPTFLQTGGFSISNGSSVTKTHEYSQFYAPTSPSVIKIPGYPKASNVTATTQSAGRKSVKLDWKYDICDETNVDENGKWRIFRQRTGKPTTEVILGDVPYNTLTYTCADQDIDYDSLYTYIVCFVPNGWEVNNEHSDAEGLSDFVRYTVKRDFAFNDLSTANTAKDITFNWSHTGITDASGSNPYLLIVQRSLDNKNWTDVKTINITSKNTTSGSYVDNNNLQLYETYYYRLKITVQDYDYVSDVASGSLTGTSEVKEFTASRGTYSNSVKLQWTVDQKGTGTTYFELQRRPLGSTDDNDFATIHTTSGVSRVYSYDDQNASTGSFYEYRIHMYAIYNDNIKGQHWYKTDGFCNTTGVLSGRVYYDTGTAVSGVKILLTPNDADNENISNFRSLNLSSAGAGLKYECTNDVLKKLLNSKSLSFQMYLNPNSYLMNADGQAYNILDVASTLGLVLKYNKAEGCYLIGSYGSDGVVSYSTLSIPADSWSHVTLTYDSSTGTFTSYTASADEVKSSQIATGKAVSVNSSATCIALGNKASFNSDYNYSGGVDEFRLFTKALTSDEISKNFNHTLSGSESSLAIYWPMDEALDNQTLAYDFSKTNDVSNGRHAKVVVAAKSDTNVPNDDQLSLSTYTDVNGNYVVRGIPFSGDGTNYVVTPVLGVHEFSPSSTSRFFSRNSLVNSGADFNDVSSFEVSGTVYYRNTNIPLEGANFYVDGVICSINGEPAVSDANGKYTISVPIGEHYINVVKTGHTFENNGRYPADPNNTGLTATFIKEISNLSFYDNTLVPVAGRVVGGDVQADKPLGFGESKNNIGKATITLAIENKSLAKIVSQKETTFEIVDTTDINVASSTDNIKSKTVRKACENEQDLTGEVVIVTDSTTGEFCAMLPPLQYKITSVEVKSNNKLVFPAYSNILDATDVNNVQTDSIIDAGGAKQEFNYVARFDLKYTSEPIFDIEDYTNDKNGLFGEEYVRQTVGGSTEDVKTITADKKYAFGYPIYLQSGKYEFGLHVYEKYKNYDDRLNILTDSVDLEGTEIIVSNGLGEQVQVIADPNGATDEDGNSYQAGDAYQVGTESVVLDKDGRGTYMWTAGLPNITAPYARGISFYYNKDGKQYNWVNKGTPIADVKEGLQGIIIGDLPTGTNVLTQGPDRVLYVLRDPPGTNSSATWSSGSSVSYQESNSSSVTEGSETNSDVYSGIKVTTIAGAIAGMTVMTGQVIEEDNMEHIKIDNETNTTLEEGTTNSVTVTSTSDISTSDGFDFVGQAGDVFVGASTNISYGKANRVDIRKINGVWTLGVEKQTTLGSEFSTEFTYELNAIQGTIIPEFIEQRNELFRNNISVNSKEEAMKYVNNTTEPIYLTWLSTDDPRYGSSNTDADIWGEEAAKAAKGKFYGDSYVCVLPKNSDPQAVYQDKVLYYNQQVANWEKILSDNEKAKVQAKQDRKTWLDKNFTFSAGASRTETQETESSTGSTCEASFETTFATGSNTEIETSFGGINIDYKFGVTYGNSSSIEETKTYTNSVSYTLAEDGDDDMISVDVYRAPDNFGPIFITRGGQTCAPYEGATYTEYYEPGTLLNEATMQIEKPALYVGNNEKTQLISGVAIGKKANFTLHCKNESETGEDCYFYLIPMQETISGGAILSTSQGPIGTGKFEVYVPAGETTDVVVSLAQNDQSILDYDNIGIRLASTSQYDPTGVNEVIDDTVHISAHFVAGSTDVNMKLANNVMNIGTGTNLGITVQGYDKDWKNLKEIRLQYRGERETEWSNAKIYVPSGKEVEGKTEAIPDDGTISFTLDMSNINLFPDQTYYFRAQSATSTGATTEATYESEVQTLIKDVTAPQIFGTPRPTNGVLGVGDEISLTYNEDIKNNILTDVDNFKVTAILNEDEIKHDVALKFDGSATADASTEADFNLAGKSFTTDMWVNVKSAGTIFSHGNGTNKLTLGVDSKGHLVVNIADKTYTSSETMPMGDGKWNYLAFNYDSDSSTPQINAMVAYDASTKMLFSQKNVEAYDGNGRIAVGENIEGAIQELTLWNKVRTMTECQATMYQTKKPSTEGLIGYWKFNEGKDLAAADLSRSRSMVLQTASWYLNNVNYAVALDGRSYVNINTSACPVSTTENYAFEMWFKGTLAKNASKTLFSVGSDKLSAGFDASGAMQLTSGTYTMQLGSANYLDNAWHHFALNVLRNGNATVYVDGTSVGQTAQSNIQPLADAYVTLGAKRWSNDGVDSFKDYFTGSIDEVRIWNATLTGATIRDAMNKRLSGEEDGLVAYYPFEYKHLDSYNQVVTDFTLADRIEEDNYRTAAQTPGEVHGSAPKASDAPALKPNVTETNLQFSYVANERSIIINLNEDADLLDGTTVHITVKSVSDQNGNVAKATRWTAYVKQNVLTWAQDNVSIKVKNGEKSTFSATMTNQSGSSQDWSLSTLPSWLSADASTGTISALGNKTINFTVSSATQVGKYEETIYLTDNNGISVPLTVNVNVAGEGPAWNVDANAFDNYKPMVGVIKVKHVLSEDENDMVGAFINGECRGVAYPEYEKDYDTYYVNLRVYGNSSEDYQKNVEFKIWDASQCKVFASVITSPDATVLFDADKVSGSYQDPFIWDTDNKIEQSQLLEKGWNWISLYVHPDPNAIGTVFKTIADKTVTAKSYQKMAQVADGSWTGSMTKVDYNDMYKVLVSDSVTLTTLGEEVEATAGTSTVDIANGWTWIGVNASYNMSLNSAFSGLDPQDGDVVKGQYGFATYDKYTWRGTLKGLTPGLGYIYMNTTSSKKFNYPSKAAAQVSSSLAKSAAFKNEDVEAVNTVSHFAFDGASYTQYPDNMTVIGKVVGDAGAVSGAEVAVCDADGQIREMQTADAEGIVFLTIPGDASTGKFCLKVFDGEQEVTAPQTINYANNAMYGTMDSPFIISATDATGISGATLAGLKFYPVNPTTTLNVDSENSINKIVIYNVDGKMVNSINTGFAQHNEINVSSLPAGVYQVMVDVQGFGTTVKSIFKK